MNNKAGKCSKPGRVIASRYMQSALSRASPKSLSRNASESSAPGISNTESCRTTPKGLPPSPSKNQFMSTPTTDNTSAPVFDASSIVADQSMMPALKEPLVVSGVKKVNNRAKKAGPVVPTIGLRGSLPKKEDKLNDVKTKEAEIDLLYAQYIQAVLLESEAKLSLKKRAEASLESLYNLWALNLKMQQQKHIKEQELRGLLYLEKVHRYCNRMKEWVEPLNKNLLKLMPQYTKLSDAVERELKHQLNAPNVIFSLEEIEPRIKAILALLEEFVNGFKNELNEISETAILASNASRLKEEAENDLQACHQSMEEMEYMVMKESSLKIAALQLKEPEHY